MKMEYNICKFAMVEFCDPSIDPQDKKILIIGEVNNIHDP